MIPDGHGQRQRSRVDVEDDAEAGRKSRRTERERDARRRSVAYDALVIVARRARVEDNRRDARDVAGFERGYSYRAGCKYSQISSKSSSGSWKPPCGVRSVTGSMFVILRARVWSICGRREAEVTLGQKEKIGSLPSDLLSASRLPSDDS